MHMLSTIFMSLVLLGNLACTSASQPDQTTEGIVIEDTAVAKKTNLRVPVSQEETKPSPTPAEQTPAPIRPSTKPVTAATPAPANKTPEVITTKPDTGLSTSPPVDETSEEVIPSPQAAKEMVAEEPEVTEAPIEPLEEELAPDHSEWTRLLQKHVNTKGDVNYAGFKRDQAQLDAYLAQLSQNPIAASWSRNEKLAYWINAYNAFTIKLIVDNYPVKSITNLKGGKPWDVKWIQLGGKTYSLNQIENEIIRPQFKEPRIHFAVNCAAQSCPPLLNKAWTAGQLNTYFEQQTKAFINNSTYNQITPSRVQVSKIFDWYGEDFGNLINFLNRYSDTKIKANAKVSFLEYDWSLNKQ